MTNIKQKVNKNCAKSQNAYMFGGFPVFDNTGKIISMQIAAYGFVGDFFEIKEIQTRLLIDRISI